MERIGTSLITVVNTPDVVSRTWAIPIAKRTDDVEFMFVSVYNLFFHFQQEKKVLKKLLEIQFRFVCVSFGL